MATEIQIVQSTNYNQQELIKAVIHKQSSYANASGVEGEIYYNTTTNILYYHDGSIWQPVLVQPDWNQATSTAWDYIKNKPTLYAYLNSYYRKNDISTNVPFNVNKATYTSTWDTATYSENWNSALTRTTTDRLKNTSSFKRVVTDNCAFFITASSLDMVNVTTCYAELFFKRYQSNGTLIETVKLDRQYIPDINTGTQVFWANVNLTVQGDITYDLNENEYSKIILEINYDGTTPNIDIEGFHEHKHVNKT